MKLSINGKEREVPGGLTVAALLEHLELPAAQVAVEHNGTLVRRAEHSETQLADGDSIEVVTLVGGG